MGVILIVEDDFLICECAAQMVTDWGHTTLTADDAAGAAEHLHSALAIDAVFTDIRLRAEHQAGYEIARLAVRLRPNIRVLYTTGDLISDQTRGLFVAGASFIRKPYAEADLQKAIAELLTPSG